MIDIYSPSGKETEISDFLKEYISTQKIEITSQDVSDERNNLIYRPDSDYTQLVFLGHIDTVPAFSLDNYRYSEEDGLIYGLGSSDMKGGCAAMIEAFTSYREAEGTAPPAALALVVGEEETGDGCMALLKDHHFTWAIVGEPTNLLPCFTHYGYVEFMLNTFGKRSHASMANHSQNAIREMLRILLKISDYLDKERQEIIYNIRDVNSSHAGFAVPDRCEAWMDLHMPSRFPIGELIYELEELISENIPEKHSIDEVLSFSTVHQGYQLAEKGIIPEILKEVYKKHTIDWQTGEFPSDSDGSILWREGVRPIILGPGQLEHAHTYDELIDFAQVQKAAELYLDILYSFKNESSS